MATKEKEKICFVIMPISDNSNYPTGHFNRVYEYIIKPACIDAGFTPLRADDVKSTNYIAIDIIKKIIESDMAICDLSSQNANVLYELGIRQAFNKPVTLIKDNQTKRIFDIQGFRDMPYDSSLRIDNVNVEVSRLSVAITETYQNNATEINSLIKLLGILPAEVTEQTKLSLESKIILDQLSTISKRLDLFERGNINRESENTPTKHFTFFDNEITQLNLKKFTDTELISLKPGVIVYHERFGTGKVTEVSGEGDDRKITINFEASGIKKLLLRFTPLYQIL